jgi:vacuolar-type H+-ATPase subunit I/STV1
LEKWAEAKGEDEEDLISDEIMYNDWAWFMVDSFETSTDSFKAEYDWIRDVEVDGRSGGWLLLTLNYSHSDLISDLAVYAGQPEEDLSDLSNPEILADLQRLSSDPDQLSELVEIGIIDEDAAESINDIIDDLAELEKEVDRHFERFNTVKEDLTKITKEIDDFKQNAVSYFYKWLSEGL